MRSFGKAAALALGFFEIPGRRRLLLANIGDSNRRCSSNITTYEFDETLVDYNLCNNATGNVQRHPKYLAPVVTLPVTGLGDSATGSVAVVDETAASKVRVFLKQGDGWTYVAPDHTFTADQLRRRLNLGVDAREVRTDRWDGDSFSDRYNGDFERFSALAGLEKPVLRANQSDEWTLDFFEAGYTTMPGADGPVTLRVMIASAQKSSSRIQPHRWLFREMRSDTVGAVQHYTYGDTTDSTGNLETVPPYTLNGKT
ncbi:hypothetical protein ARSEF4850_002153 [Beauveria asiatica]